MDVAEARKAAEALREVAEAVRQVGDAKYRVKLARAIRRAAGDAGDRAISAMCSAAATVEDDLDEWAHDAGNNQTANTLALVSMRLKWRADLAERPDDLKDILAERMERGMAYMPKALLKALYELGAGVREIKAGRMSGREMEERAKALLDAAGEWAERVETGRDTTEDAVVCVAPF
jgi:hypothetical protein